MILGDGAGLRAAAAVPALFTCAGGHIRKILEAPIDRDGWDGEPVSVRNHLTADRR